MAERRVPAKLRVDEAAVAKFVADMRRMEPIVQAFVARAELSRATWEPHDWSAF